MDFASLKEAAANLSLYDIKAGVRKVQNGESARGCQHGDSKANMLASGDELHGNGSEGQGGDEQ